MLIILNHWYEIKLRLFYIVLAFIITFMTSYLYSDILMYIYVYPFILTCDDKKLIFTNLVEAFSSCLSISLNVSLLVTLFFFTYSMFSFLKPGLYEKELHLLKVSTKLFIMNLLFSIYFVYVVILPGVINFFTHFESYRLFELSLEAKISDYLELVLQCIFLISIVFQIPVLVFVCLYLKIFNVTSLIVKRKELIIVCFIVGALLSPPDIFTQLLIALPLWMLSEIAILIFIVIDEYSHSI
jgi:sec-independent protein translocase protein TatC